MRASLLLVASLAWFVSPLRAIGPAPAPPGPPTQADVEEYRAFVKAMTSVENLADCIVKMDALIDSGEHGSGWATAVSKNGFHLSFQCLRSEQAILYYFVISRDGKILELNEATKIAALFCDRAGLLHPIDIRTGENPIFTAQWLIKPSEWKKVNKAMLKLRAENRMITHPQQAFVNAVDHELDARANFRR
jgi:hypothetical protein